MKTASERLRLLRAEGVCLFCRRKDSSKANYLLKTMGFFAHQFCMAFNSRLTQFEALPDDPTTVGGFKIEQVLSAFNADRFNRCHVCQQRYNISNEKGATKARLKSQVVGASAGCAYRKCRKAFHYPCSPIKKKYKRGNVVFYRVYCSQAHLRLDRTVLDAEISALNNGKRGGKTLSSSASSIKSVTPLNADLTVSSPEIVENSKKKAMTVICHNEPVSFCASNSTWGRRQKRSISRHENSPSHSNEIVDKHQSRDVPGSIQEQIEDKRDLRYQDDDADSLVGVDNIMVMEHDSAQTTPYCRLLRNSKAELVLDVISIKFCANDDVDDWRAQDVGVVESVSCFVWPFCLPPVLRRIVARPHLKYHLLEVLETLVTDPFDATRFFDQLFLNLDARTLEEYEAVRAAELRSFHNGPTSRQLRDGYLRAFESYVARAKELGRRVSLAPSKDSFELVIDASLDPTVEIRRRFPKTVHLWNEVPRTYMGSHAERAIYPESEFLFNFLQLSTKGLRVVVDVVDPTVNVLRDNFANETFDNLLAKVKRARITDIRFPKTRLTFIAPVNSELVNFEKYARAIFKKALSESGNGVNGSEDDTALSFLVVPIELNGGTFYHPTALVPSEANSSQTRLEIVTAYETDYSIVIFQIEKH